MSSDNAPISVSTGSEKKSSIGDHKVIRHSYDNLLTAAARLLAFSYTPAKVPEGPVFEHQEVLILDDLISFAIHARRFTENTITQKVASSHLLQRSDGIQGKNYSLTRLINVIVHNQSLRICRTENELKILGGDQSFENLMTANIKYFPQPICFITSDTSTIFSFRLGDFIESFQATMLHEIMQICEDQKLYLDNVYNL